MKVGFVPEHFSTPIAFAAAKGYFDDAAVAVELIPYPSGSGHLIQSLKSGEIDLGIGLTEAFVKGIADGDAEYQIAGTYVESPLCWAVSTGVNRDDITDKAQLQGKTVGVSRIGSGSYVMPFVLALESGFQEPFYSKFEPLSTFKNLRDSVNLQPGVAASDAFMWEHFTSKKYYDNGEIKKIGEIYTPWSSWVLVPRTQFASEKKHELVGFLDAINRGIEYFNTNPEEAIAYIAANLDYSAEDAREWLKTVKFPKDTKKIDLETTVLNTAKVLNTAGVVQKNGESSELVATRLVNGVVKF